MNEHPNTIEQLHGCRLHCPHCHLIGPGSTDYGREPVRNEIFRNKTIPEIKRELEQQKQQTQTPPEQEKTPPD